MIKEEEEEGGGGLGGGKEEGIPRYKGKKVFLRRSGDKSFPERKKKEEERGFFCTLPRISFLTPRKVYTVDRMLL